MSNQTIVAVPTKFEEFKQIRAFIVRLVTELDIVLGYRGEDPYVTATTLTTTGSSSSRTVGEQLEELKKAIEELESVVATGDATTLERLDTIQALTPIVDHSYTAPTAGVGYSQAQMQDTVDNLALVNDKLNELFVILRTASIVT